MGARIGGQVGLTGGQLKGLGGHCMLKNALVDDHVLYNRNRKPDSRQVVSGSYEPVGCTAVSGI